MLINALLIAAAFVQSQAEPCPAIMVENFSILQFDSGSAELSPSVRLQLDAWLSTISGRTYPTRFELIGQADRVGTREANHRLSFRRADGVRRYLISHGVSDAFISVRAEGEGRRLVETEDEVPEPANRVVQLISVADERERLDSHTCPTNQPVTG